MANKSLFSKKSSVLSKKVTLPTNAVNEAGGAAYKLSDKGELAQLVVTGCYNNTYYVSGEDQLKRVLELSNRVDPTFVAKLAVYARQNGLMKDAPAVLAAVLASKDSTLLSKVFSRVIDDPKMLRNFVQILRSGATGRKSLGTAPKRLVQNYLDSLTDEQLFKADVGNDPSLSDIIKMVHPKPTNKKRSALFAYLIDKKYNAKDLCDLAKKFESFKKDMSKEMPDVPFQMLTALPLKDGHWKEIASHATCNQIRINLNTFARHNVFNDPKIVSALAEKLSNKDQIKRAKMLPYQLFTAFLNVESNVPVKLTNALQDAAEHALDNIPEFNGKVYVMVDTSGSMRSPVTGDRGSATTKMRYVDVAALFASAILRKNPETEVVPFDTRVHEHKLNPRDSIMTNAKALAAFGGGGTNCSAALAYLNKKSAKGDLVIYVSDNASWMDNSPYGGKTETMSEWNKFSTRNPNSKLVCIDIAPYGTTQAHDRNDILNLGGFNDSIFEVISKFAELGSNKDLWVKTIESVDL